MATPTIEPRSILYQSITDQIIRELEHSTVPWHKPWSCGTATRSGRRPSCSRSQPWSLWRSLSRSTAILTIAQLGSAPLVSYGAGLLIGFYGLSATIIIPRFGAASFIAFILIAQLLTSAAIDQFGLFGMGRRPIDMTKAVGLIVIVAGIAIMEVGNLIKPRP